MSPRRKRGEEPKVKTDARGYAWIEWNGRHPLGKFGSEEFYERKEAVLRQWREAEFGRQPVANRAGTVKDLTVAFMRHARRHYLRDDLTETEEVGAFERALKPLLSRCGDKQPRDVTAEDLKALRSAWVHAGYTRQEINKRVGRIRHVFRWGVGEKLVPAAVVVELEAVRDLQAGRTPAPEQQDVAAADPEAVKATLPFLPKRPAVMAQLQLLCGCRPGEICRIKGAEIHKGQVKLGRRTFPITNWAFVPSWHKTKRRGKTVFYILNAQARALLEPFLRENQEEYLFKPTEEDAEWRAAQEEGNRSRRRVFAPRYSVDRYGKWVRAACAAAGVEPWTPNQLRHAFATQADRLAGIESASTMLGHTNLSTTEIYVEKNIKMADKLADRINLGGGENAEQQRG